jgi:hypothetical protein
MTALFSPVSIGRYTLKNRLVVIAAFLLEMFAVTAAMAEPNCIAAVEATRADWRALSHSSFLRPWQHIRLPDGRVVAGSLLNYSHVLIWRAENACGAGQVEQARGYISEASNLLHPGFPGPLIASPDGK